MNSIFTKIKQGIEEAIECRRTLDAAIASLPELKLTESIPTQEIAEPAGKDDDTGTPDSWDPSFLKHLGNQVWRIRQRVVDPASGEAVEELDPKSSRRIARAVEALIEELERQGVRIRDRTGERYDQGLPEKVIVVEERAELACETIIETLKPTIHLDRTILQLGEIIVGKPTNGPS
ncbi:MAG: hypothetical protein KDN05_07610 [Verrucomicrobiae bacterium]|nr:hypothetical protein [Verrucomicrobiae bacterium]